MHTRDLLQIRHRDDAIPEAHIAIAVEGAPFGHPDFLPLLVVKQVGFIRLMAAMPTRIADCGQLGPLPEQRASRVVEAGRGAMAARVH